MNKHKQMRVRDPYETQADDQDFLTMASLSGCAFGSLSTMMFVAGPTCSQATCNDCTWSCQ